MAAIELTAQGLSSLSHDQPRRRRRNAGCAAGGVLRRAARAHSEMAGAPLATEHCRASFRGGSATVSLRAASSSALVGDATYCTVWETSSVLLQWLSSDASMTRLLACAAPSSAPLPRWSTLRLLDISAGSGLLGLAAAAAGADVVLTDAPAALPLLSANAAAAAAAWAAAGAAAGAVTVSPLQWGADDVALCTAIGAPAAAALVCDVLYCAQRDGLARALRATLTRLLELQLARVIAFAYEERAGACEEEFVAALARGEPPAAGGEALPALAVEHVPLAELQFKDSWAAQGVQAGGHAQGELWTPWLFWEPPPVRLVLLRLAAAAAAAPR